MVKLNDKQINILKFIENYYIEYGISPSIREIQKGCNITSTSVVDYNLKSLQKNGYLNKRSDISRAIKLNKEITSIKIPILSNIAAGEPLMVNPNKLNVPPIFPDDSIVRHSLAVNYSNLIEMDKQVGKLVADLKKEGLYDDSYIFFYSDHGGPFPRHKRAIYETGTKVPFFIKFPKGKSESIDKNQFLSFVDFAPTTLSIAGIEPPGFLQGKAFLGKYKDESQREHLFTASDRFDENPDRIRAVRDEKFKYIRNYFPENSHALNVAYRKQMVLMRHLTTLHLKGKLSEEHDLWFRIPKLKEELYDLENDPFELNNLSGNPDYSDKLKNLSDVLDQWIEEIDDLGRIPEEKLYKMISGD